MHFDRENPTLVDRMLDLRMPVDLDFDTPRKDAWTAAGLFVRFDPTTRDTGFVLSADDNDAQVSFRFGIYGEIARASRDGQILSESSGEQLLALYLSTLN